MKKLNFHLSFPRTRESISTAKIIGFLGLLFTFVVTYSSADDQKPEPGKFELVSPVLKQDEDMPQKYTCQGGDSNPPLEIKNVPLKTKALALTMVDLDAPEGVWVHWVVYNIPPNKNVISENSIPGSEALNDLGKYHYGGPCPADEKQHRYVFTAYAVNEILPIDEGMTMKDLEKSVQGRTIAKSVLTATYRKPVW